MPDNAAVMKRALRKSEKKMSIVRQVTNVIEAAHAAEAEGYFDVCY